MRGGDERKERQGGDRRDTTIHISGYATVTSRDDVTSRTTDERRGR